MKIITPFNFRDNANRVIPQTCKAPSLTVPRLSLTVDELISRFERGVPLPASKVPIYESHIDAYDEVASTGRSIKHADLIDIHYMKKSYLERRDILKKAIDEQNEANAKAIAARKVKLEEYYAKIDKLDKASKGDSGTNTP